MKKDRIKQPISCHYCNEIFYAVRSDAKRCPSCHDKRRKAHQQSDRGRELKAICHRKIRQKAFEGYGGKCACCGEDKYEFLAIDHVNGNGSADRKKHNTWQIAKRVIENGFPSDYRVLCHNCNASIGWYGYCPHNKK